MLRITPISKTRAEAVLKIEGRISGKDVAVLEQEGEHRFRDKARLVLDLDGVQLIDVGGIALLQRWSKRGLVLRGGSPFVRKLLETCGLATPAVNAVEDHLQT